MDGHSSDSHNWIICRAIISLRAEYMSLPTEVR